jgi:hypothetical protein
MKQPNELYKAHYAGLVKFSENEAKQLCRQFGDFLDT